jgi:hypothetical protein
MTASTTIRLQGALVGDSGGQREPNMKAVEEG